MKQFFYIIIFIITWTALFTVVLESQGERKCFRSQRDSVIKCFAEKKNFIACESAFKDMCK